jgi:pimeloyl-ACP methyl ester carboxylesterase
MSLQQKATAGEGKATGEGKAIAGAGDDRLTGILMTVAEATGRGPRHGTFAEGIRYVTWGGGPRSLLFIAGEEAPTGLTLRMYRWLLRPYVDAGYTVWFVGRRHPMPSDYTVADMGEDYARVITDEFGGRVDLLVGESTGGMIGQYLAADHPESFGSVALVAAAAKPTDAGKDINAR